MFTRKIKVQGRRMPTAEEFASWGAYELSFEELLEVNGGKREKKEKSEKSSGGGKSSKSSGGGGGSSKGFFGSGSKKSSGGETKSKETNKEKKTKTQTGTTGTEGKKNGSGTSAGGGLKGGEPKSKEEKKSGGAEYTVQKGDTLSGIVRKQYPGASKEEIVRRVKEAAANSGIKDIDKIEPGQKIIFEKPAGNTSARPNTGEEKSPTAGGWTSRERRTSSGRGSLWGGGRESGYRPETGVQTGGGQPLSENKAQTGMRQEGGMQNTETQGVRSKISGFFDRLWNKFGNVNKTNAESYLGKSRGGNWQSKENFPAPTVQGSKTSSEGYVPPVEQVQGPIEKTLSQKFAETQTALIGTKYVYGAENPLNPQEGGVDCSGAVQYGLRTMGFMLPNRVDADTFLKKYTTEIERTEMQTGDLRGLQTQGGKFYHVQTLMDTYRVNPCGDETNTKDNPGIVESLSSSLPASGVIRRLDENALNPYYDSSKDIVGGKLSVGQLDRAFSALLKYSN